MFLTRKIQHMTITASTASKGKKSVSASARGRPAILLLERRIWPRATEPRMVVPNGASIPNGSRVKDKSLAMREGEGGSPVLVHTTANDQYIPNKATKKNGIHKAPQTASFENFAW